LFCGDQKIERIIEFGRPKGNKLEMIRKCNGRAMRWLGNSMVGKCNGRAMQWSGNAMVRKCNGRVNRLGKRNLGKGRSERGRGEITRCTNSVSKKGNIGDRQVWWFLPQQENGLGDFGD
jgi:hypothetical protein